MGKIPRDMYEDELVPVFERAGRIYEFRLMMEFSGENRGYCLRHVHHPRGSPTSYPAPGQLRNPPWEVHRGMCESGQLSPFYRLHPERQEKGGDPRRDDEGQHLIQLHTLETTQN